MSEWSGWLHDDWKFSQVDQNCRPNAVWPSPVVTMAPPLAMTQCPEVTTTPALRSVPVHDPTW